jgi:DNA-binding CsgD family transcriptional regulator/tetratricopeptide (TPR) repeat protein
MGGRVASPTFVGRIEELHALEVARRRAADGEPAVVLVGGEAGVGKTRLLAELAARCAVDGTRVVSGGSVPVGGSALPYAPIVEVLRVLASDLGTDAVRELAGPSWPELARVLPALGEPQPSGPPGQSAQARLFEVLLGLLGRFSEQTPLVLAVEDVHWSDQSTRDLLAFLVRNLRHERILLIVSYRSDEPQTAWLGPWLAELDRGPVQRLELPRLDRTETMAQLVAILGAAPPTDLVDAVFARSEGNPFFTEELLAAVQAGSDALPATIRDLLRGRLQALPGETRQVLAVVAVAGRRVSHRLLAAVAGLEDQPLVAALHAAVAQELLVTYPGQDGYELRHALLREILDADLLPGERIRLHARYAKALAERPELAGAVSGLAAELAAHWDTAGEPAHELPARVAAGLAAERARGFPEAYDHYMRALELWDRVPEPGRPSGLDRVDLLAHGAEAAAIAGAVQHAVELLEDALERLDPAGEPVRGAVLLARLGVHRWTARDEAGALAAYQQAERLLAGAPPSAERARVLAAHAQTLGLAGRGDEGVPRCEEAIAVARAVGARAEEACALDILGDCLDHHRDPDRSIALHLEARRIAEQAGDAETVMSTHLNLGHALKAAGRDRESLEDAQQGYQRARQLGLERATGSYVAANLARGLLASGRWRECEQVTAELLAVDTWAASELHAARGQLLVRQGDFAAAREQLNLSLRLSPSSQRVEGWFGLAELGLWEGREEEVETAIAEGLRWYAQWDPEGVVPGWLLRWYGLALRLEADRAERAAARRTPEEVARARRRAAPILAGLDQLVAGQRQPQRIHSHITCTLLYAEAERSRLEGPTDPQRWKAAAVAWEQLARPFETAYARFRHTESLLATDAPRSQAEQTLRPAHQVAATLGAAPLRREIERLASRGRLRLIEPAGVPAVPTPPPSPTASLGLTRRETEVLALVAEGRTNRQIGQELFITEKTASLHVSRILAKLGVASRGEAGAVAHRLGLSRQ